MSDVKQIFAEKKFPQFLTSHNVFRTLKEIKKVFPEIGLPNTEKEIEVDNKKEAQAAAQMLLNEINAMIEKRLRNINKFAVKKTSTEAGGEASLKLMGAARKKKMEKAVKLLESMKAEILKSKDKFFVTNNGRVTINLPADILDPEEKVAFKNGEGLFRVYNKLNDILRDGHFCAMTKLEDLAQFKDFSAKNVPALKYKVRFSSDGSDGAWDITTMSMRGVTSCQSWTPNATQGTFTHIVGSVVDPFTGIIYLTSGGKFNEYGTKMIRRCVVRFVVDEAKKLPFIALERMYPAAEASAVQAFIEFLKERTDNKFDVVYLPDSRKYGGMYVPLSKVVGALPVNDQPYRDSQVPYKSDTLDVQGRLRLVHADKMETVYTTFSSKVVAAARAMKMGAIPEESKNAFRSLRGTDYAWDQSYSLYEALVADIRGFFTKRPNDQEDSGMHLRDCLEAFLKENLEERIYGIVRNISRTKIDKSRGVLGDDVIKELARISNEKIVTYLTAEMNKIKVVEKKKSVKAANSAASAIPIYTRLLT